MRGKLQEELLHRIREDRFQRNGDFKPDLAGWQHSWHANPFQARICREPLVKDCDRRGEEICRYQTPQAQVI